MESLLKKFPIPSARPKKSLTCGLWNGLWRRVQPVPTYGLNFHEPAFSKRWNAARFAVWHEKFTTGACGAYAVPRLWKVHREKRHVSWWVSWWVATVGTSDEHPFPGTHIARPTYELVLRAKGLGMPATMHHAAAAWWLAYMMAWGQSHRWLLLRGVKFKLSPFLNTPWNGQYARAKWCPFQSFVPRIRDLCTNNRSKSDCFQLSIDGNNL